MVHTQVSAKCRGCTTGGPAVQGGRTRERLVPQDGSEKKRYVSSDPRFSATAAEYRSIPPRTEHGVGDEHLIDKTKPAGLVAAVRGLRRFPTSQNEITAPIPHCRYTVHAAFAEPEGPSVAVRRVQRMTWTHRRTAHAARHSSLLSLGGARRERSHGMSHTSHPSALSLD